MAAASKRFARWRSPWRNAAAPTPSGRRLDGTGDRRVTAERAAKKPTPPPPPEGALEPHGYETRFPIPSKDMRCMRKQGRLSLHNCAAERDAAEAPAPVGDRLVLRLVDAGENTRAFGGLGSEFDQDPLSFMFIQKIDHCVHAPSLRPGQGNRHDEAAKRPACVARSSPATSAARFTTSATAPGTLRRRARARAVRHADRTTGGRQGSRMAELVGFLATRRGIPRLSTCSMGQS
jgi:hypothetical protein